MVRMCLLCEQSGSGVLRKSLFLFCNEPCSFCLHEKLPLPPLCVSCKLKLSSCWRKSADSTSLCVQRQFHVDGDVHAQRASRRGGEARAVAVHGAAFVRVPSLCVSLGGLLFVVIRVSFTCNSRRADGEGVFTTATLNNAARSEGVLVAPAPSPGFSSSGLSSKRSFEASECQFWDLYSPSRSLFSQLFL